jgi:hypothetical protein
MNRRDTVIVLSPDWTSVRVKNRWTWMDCLKREPF